MKRSVENIVSAYIKIHYNNTTALTYDYLKCYVKDKGIPAEIKPKIILRFKVVDPFAIYNHDTPYNQNTPIGTVNELFLLNSAECVLKLKTKGSNKEMNVYLNSEETKLQTGGYISFSKPVDSGDIEYLNSWREGETLSIDWTINGFALLPYRVLFKNYRILNSVLSIDPFTSNANIAMGPDDFIKEILEPIGVGDKLIEEFSVGIPSFISSTANQPAAIKKLIPNLILLQRHLKLALDMFRNARSASDLSASMGKIRTPLDTIIKFKNDPDFQSLGKELFVDTGVISDIPGLPSGGAIIASQNIINDLWRQFQALANINSKSLHTSTQTQTQNFEMKPERSDPKYTLISCLSITNYLIDKIKAALLKTGRFIPL
jgi:hypothetical protein